MIPHIYQSPGSNSLTGCIDTTITTNECTTLTPITITAWTWVHYFISIDSATNELRLCLTFWRGTSTCSVATFLGEIIPFD